MNALALYQNKEISMLKEIVGFQTKKETRMKDWNIQFHTFGYSSHATCQFNNAVFKHISFNFILLTIFDH